MDNKSELFEKIRQQFDSAPYPRTPLEDTPKDSPNSLYIHNLVTAYYVRNQKVIDTKDKLILDAGCGTGYKALALAIANPGAKIVGIDFSEEAVKLAEQRLQYHGIDNAEFHVMSIEDLPSLGMEFDYINNDEVLYLITDPVAGLQAMKAVLKPDGIIRSNVHSTIQRVNFFRAQELFTIMGVMDESDPELASEMVRETMAALKNQVVLKKNAWGKKIEESTETILANILLRGDKGFTIPELFSIFRAVDLEFINMVNWRQWDLMDLFEDPDNLPVFLGMSLPEASVEEQLHIYELLNPLHRLLDFWCGHPNQGQSFVPPAEWEKSDWETARVHLHPQLKTPEMKEELVRCITQLNAFEISRFLPPVSGFVAVDSNIAACLLPLLDAPLSMKAMVERLQVVKPLNTVTMEPTTAEEALDLLINALTGLERFGYVLLERVVCS
ncbi:MAG: methyltransferase domain-containing protein [Nostocaceae cyanobacterium]|nr:methyltransferase domain-containing protein [Nostocaceae cyanobacterium]